MKSDSELIMPLVVEVVVLEAMMATEKKRKVMVLIVNMMRIWMSVVLVILYKEKQQHKQGIATKM
jgi:hypothetical protein